MGTRYTTQTAVGYNATPPPDDGSVAENNRTTWAKHKDKLADPIKVLADAINAAILAHTDESVLDTAIARTTIVGDHKRTINVTAGVTQSLADANSVAAGYIVIFKNSHTAPITIDLATATDTLDGVVDGSISLPSDHQVIFNTNALATGYISDNQFNYLRRDIDQIMNGILTIANDLVVEQTLILEQKVSETANVTAAGGAIDLDIDTGTYFYTPALTSIPTFTFSNPAATGSVNVFTLELNNAVNFLPVWPASVEWQAGVVPIWSSGKDVVSFGTRDNGATWQGYFGGFNFQVPS